MRSSPRTLLLLLSLGTLGVGCDAAAPPTASDPVSVDAAAIADVGAPDAGEAVAASDAAVSDDARAPDDAALMPGAADAAPALDASPAADASVATSTEAVRVVADPCAGRTPRGARCLTVEVTCGGLEPMQANLHIYAPPAGTTQRAVLMLGSGGSGTGLWSGPAPADALISRLVSDGYLVVEREWLAPREQGWFLSAQGMGVPVAACRLASLLRFVDAQYRRGDQPLCATGNSGGSAELTYAVTRAGAGDVLDLALPSSGPFHRLDLACDGANEAAWQAECAALLARDCPGCISRTCSLGNGPRALIDTAYGARTPCTGRQTPVDRATLAPDGPVASRVALPHTRVVLLVGEQDPGGYAPMVIALRDALAVAGVDVALETEPGAAHELPSYEPGAQHLERILARDCVRRR